MCMRPESPFKPSDVLFQSGSLLKNAGSQAFEDLIKSHATHYQGACTIKEREDLAESILCNIRHYGDGGWFMERRTTTKKWYRMDREKALSHTHEAFNKALGNERIIFPGCAEAVSELQEGKPPVTVEDLQHLQHLLLNMDDDEYSNSESVQNQGFRPLEQAQRKCNSLLASQREILEGLLNSTQGSCVNDSPGARKRRKVQPRVSVMLSQDGQHVVLPTIN
eukprot:CAMPEP_0183299094 /NCGR_PEP_ID=MMETSP0160_2-20130417/5912_1 /TAXON_ID=2839 ORGANISM="Odontella Sinensis, Strain Grunow 1884" /NCGR_SAMPLE_ID=MMETSP0160_2 /ASSEMBLY_ACC=CAM_ASM_000250 /LENGTH=221 /DNA_ID=CAMNT_0025461263 /DNA_START=108 /DNA_END=773 /DNA_ORIENTATION=+